MIEEDKLIQWFTDEALIETYNNKELYIILNKCSNYNEVQKAWEKYNNRADINQKYISWWNIFRETRKKIK